MYVEGFESKTQGMVIEYLGRANASAGELRAQLYLALDRKYIDDNEFRDASSEAQICSRQIVSLSRYLDSKTNARKVRVEGAIYDVGTILEE